MMIFAILMRKLISIIHQNKYKRKLQQKYGHATDIYNNIKIKPTPQTTSHNGIWQEYKSGAHMPCFHNAPPIRMV